MGLGRVAFCTFVFDVNLSVCILGFGFGFGLVCLLWNYFCACGVYAGCFTFSSQLC